MPPHWRWWAPRPSSKASAGNPPGADIIAHCTERHAPALYARWAEAAGHAVWLVEAEEGGAPIGCQVLACRTWRPSSPSRAISI